jgi:NADH-quinone oxidoreductase subunit M
MTGSSYILSALFFLSGAWVASRPSLRQARAVSSGLAGLGVALSVAGPLITHQHNWPAVQASLISVVTLAAVSLSALTRIRQSTLFTIFWLGASHVLLTVSNSPSLMTVIWVSSVALTWWEARKHSRKASRLFSVYLGISTLLLALGLLSGSASLLVLVAIALCIREAGLPFHSWFLSFVEDLPMGLVVAFTCPQVGVLFHLRFLSGQLSSSYHHELAIIGVLTAFFGAALATVQPSLRRTLGYLIISQSGLVAFGAENLDTVAHTGALACWLVVGLAGAGFAMTIEALESRNGGPVDLESAFGNFESMPILATSFLLNGMAMVGLPGSLGLIAEDLLVQGAVEEFPMLGFSLIVVTALNAITIMKCLLKIFAGSTTCNCPVDLVGRERAALTFVLLPLFLFGLFPGLVLGWLGG